MKKKRVIVAGIVCIALGIATMTYVGLGKERVEVQTHGHLLQQGYTNADISTIDVKHSFVNLILSREEWTSTVVFMDELDVQYHYTLEDDKIVSFGVTGEITDEDDLKHVE